MVSKEENEIRLIVFTHLCNDNNVMSLPKGDGKHIYVWYDSSIIKRIWIKDNTAKNMLMNEPRIMNFICKNCVDLKVYEK